VPRKICQLRADLRKAGFSLVKGQGKGSHTKWRHPLVPGSISVSGADGADAKDYQEADIHVWIARAQEAEKRQRP
jgi:predicted RNA binding protein YcfA (HicA-like mRNA interferase family)